MYHQLASRPTSQVALVSLAFNTSLERLAFVLASNWTVSRVFETQKFCVCFFVWNWGCFVDTNLWQGSQKNPRMGCFVMYYDYPLNFGSWSRDTLLVFLGWLVESQCAAHLMGEPKMTAIHEHDISAWSKIPIHPRKMTNSLSNSSLNHAQPPG